MSMCFSCGCLPSLYLNLFFNNEATEYLKTSSFSEIKQTSSKLKILTVSSNICKYTLKENILTSRLTDNLSVTATSFRERNYNFQSNLLGK